MTGAKQDDVASRFYACFIAGNHRLDSLVADHTLAGQHILHYDEICQCCRIGTAAISRVPLPRNSIITHRFSGRVTQSVGCVCVCVCVRLCVHLDNNLPLTLTIRTVAPTEPILVKLVKVIGWVHNQHMAKLQGASVPTA